MAKQKRNTKRITREADSMYFLKLVVLLVLGSFWLRIAGDGYLLPLPLGLIAGVTLLRNERFKVDKKIEYALLLVAAFISFWLPLGIHISL